MGHRSFFRDCRAHAATLAALLVLGGLWAAERAAAQDTGGSFGDSDWGSDDYGGGSDWGSSDSDWGSSDSDWGSSYDYGSDDYDYGTSGDYGGSTSYGGSDYSGSGGGADAACFGAFLCIGFIAFLFFVAVSGARGMMRVQSSYDTPVVAQPRAPTRAWNKVDLTQIRVALDAEARPFVQAELLRLAHSSGPRGKKRIAQLLTTTARMLRRVDSAWLYADVTNYHPMSPPQAQGIFQQLAVQARAGFKHELVRNVGGAKITHAGPEKRAREDEGQGLVLVTLVAAAKKEIVDVHTVDANGVRRLLDGLCTLSEHDVVALEVIWTPAAEEDRMSSAELEALYPGMTKLVSATAIGRVYCGYCHGPYAAELPRCPHCGAPSARGS